MLRKLLAISLVALQCNAAEEIEKPFDFVSSFLADNLFCWTFLGTVLDRAMEEKNLEKISNILATCPPKQLVLDMIAPKLEALKTESPEIFAALQNYQPTQEGRDQALINAATLGQTDLVTELINLTIQPPSKSAIEEALLVAVINPKSLLIVKELLSKDLGDSAKTDALNKMIELDDVSEIDILDTNFSILLEAHPPLQDVARCYQFIFPMSSIWVRINLLRSYALRETEQDRLLRINPAKIQFLNWQISKIIERSFDHSLSMIQKLELQLEFQKAKLESLWYCGTPDLLKASKSHHLDYIELCQQLRWAEAKALGVNPKTAFSYGSKKYAQLGYNPYDINPDFWESGYFHK